MAKYTTAFLNESIQTVIDSRANLRTARDAARVPCTYERASDTRGGSRMASSMVKALFLLEMAPKFMKENGYKIKRMALEFNTKSTESGGTRGTSLRADLKAWAPLLTTKRE